MNKENISLRAFFTLFDTETCINDKILNWALKFQITHYKRYKSIKNLIWPWAKSSQTSTPAKSRVTFNAESDFSTAHTIPEIWYTSTESTGGSKTVVCGKSLGKKLARVWSPYWHWKTQFRMHCECVYSKAANGGLKRSNPKYTPIGGNWAWRAHVCV